MKVPNIGMYSWNKKYKYAGFTVTFKGLANIDGVAHVKMIDSFDNVKIVYKELWKAI